MIPEIFKTSDTPEAWRVELLDADGDGGVSVATFSGPDAEAHARKYALGFAQGGDLQLVHYYSQGPGNP